MSIVQEIRDALFAEQDLKFREFHKKLIPTIPEKTVIGVRTPALRKMAKEFAKHKDVEKFLCALPHKYYDENQIHCFILCGIKDFEKGVDAVNRFLPFIDNWATCDQLRPACFNKKNNRNALLECICGWLKGMYGKQKCENPYVVRFGIEMLMTFFLDDDFKPEYLDWIAKIRSEEYYVNMMIAWFFATAMAKQYEATVPYIEQKKLAPWVHNKTIQKSVESFRITDGQKKYLRSLKLV